MLGGGVGRQAEIPALDRDNSYKTMKEDFEWIKVSISLPLSSKQVILLMLL